MVLFVTGVMLFSLLQILRGKGKPEELVLPAWSPPKALGLVPVGVALLLLFRFSRDTASYWLVAAAVLWILIGAFTLLGPSLSQLTDDQRRRVARGMAKAWWVLPSTVAIFLVGFVVLALFAPRWAVSAFATACLCGFSIEIALSFLRFRRVLGEDNS